MIDGLAGVKNRRNNCLRVFKCRTYPDHAYGARVRPAGIHAGVPEVWSNTWRVGFHRSKRKGIAEFAKRVELLLSHLAWLRFGGKYLPLFCGALLGDASGKAYLRILTPFLPIIQYAVLVCHAALEIGQAYALASGRAVRRGSQILHGPRDGNPNSFATWSGQ